MTISSEDRVAGPFIGNDATVAFPFTFKVFTAADVRVVQTDVDLDQESDLVLNTDYTVNLNANQNTNPGGTVTLTSALAAGQNLTITSSLSYLQPTDLTNQGGFYPSVITNALDRLTIFAQQLAEQIERSIKIPLSTTGSVSTQLPSPEANSFIAWNNSATALENMDASALATVVAYGTARADTFTGDGVTAQFNLTDNPGAQANLDVSVGGVTQTPVDDYTWAGGTVVTFTSPPPNGVTILIRYMQGLPFGTLDASNVTFEPVGAGAVTRSVESKLRDVVSVTDRGAIGDGVIDDTTAFSNAGDGAQVPAGEYLVDTEQVDVFRYSGTGEILSTGGALISIEGLPHKLVQKKLMEPFFGFDNGVTDTQIYTNARNALQGIAYCKVSGVEKLFVTQRPTGSAFSDTERCRIVEFNLAEDGSSVAHVAYSPELNIGHGFDLSAVVDGSTVYLYTCSETALGMGGTAAGKGYSRIEWKGASTTQGDVTSYQLWGDAGSGHVFEDYNRAGVAVSSDGRLLIMVSAALTGLKRTVFVYDLAEVEALVSKLDAVPLYRWTIPVVTQEGAFSLQGVASDGRHIHLLCGGSVALGHHHLMTFDLAGNLIRKLQVDDARAQYGLEGILDNGSSLGHPARFEPEGLTIRGDEILLSCAESWRTGCKIVSFEGENWSASSFNTDTTGVPPSNGSYFVRTTKATTDGAWNDATNYGWGTGYSLEKKTIYSVRAPRGEVGEEELDAGIVDAVSEAALDAGESNVSVTYRWRDPFVVSGYSERLRAYFNGITYDTNSRLRIYDQQLGADNAQYVSVIARFDSTFKGLLIRAKNGTATAGAGVNMTALDDPSNPSAIREFTGSLGSQRRITDQYGQTTFSCSAGYDPLSSNRSDTGNGWSGYRNDVLIAGIRVSTVDASLVGFNGADVKLSTATTTTPVARWRVTNADGHLEPMDDNVYNLGSGSKRAATIYAGTGVINTSDGREKQDVVDLSAAEKRVALVLKSMIKRFRFTSAVVTKGDGARLHIGVIAQDVVAAFAAEGLDARDYGLLCFDEWEATDEAPAGNRYGVRYEELLTFIIAAM